MSITSQSMRMSHWGRISRAMVSTASSACPSPENGGGAGICGDGVPVVLVDKNIRCSFDVIEHPAKAGRILGWQAQAKRCALPAKGHAGNATGANRQRFAKKEAVSGLWIGECPARKPDQRASNQLALGAVASPGAGAAACGAGRLLCGEVYEGDQT